MNEIKLISLTGTMEKHVHSSNHKYDKQDKNIYTF